MSVSPPEFVYWNRIREEAQPLNFTLDKAQLCDIDVSAT